MKEQYVVRLDRRNVMTLDQALTLGWTLAGSAWSSGYVSRRADPMKQVLHRAGGSRAGLWYVDLPAPDQSTRRHVRQYLKPPAGLLPE